MTDTTDVAKRGPGRPRKNPASQVLVEAAAALPPPPPAVAAPIAPPPAVKAPQLSEQVKAVTSPAIENDTIPGPAATTAPISEGTESMATTAAPSVADATEKAQALFGDAQARVKTAFEKSTKMGEDLVEFTKGNVEAVIASARVAAKAGESLGQEAADYSKKSFETATAAFKSFASVKSPTELFQLQSDYAKASFDSAIAEASKLSESLMKVMGDIAQPLSSRYAVAAEKFKTTAL